MERYPEAYVQYLVYFHADRDYFECHEVLEEYWKEHPESAHRHTWVVLIQIAVAAYHERRGNLLGAVKMLDQALRGLRESELEALGLDGAALRATLQARRERLASQPVGRFVDPELPITDERLRGQCLALCAERGGQWGASSRMDDAMLIHKHTLRDRSEVVEAREREKAKRKEKEERAGG